MEPELNVADIKQEAMQLLAAGVRGQHSNNKVIRLCQEITALRAERDAAITERDALIELIHDGPSKPSNFDQDYDSGWEICRAVTYDRAKAILDGKEVDQ